MAKRKRTETPTPKVHNHKEKQALHSAIGMDSVKKKVRVEASCTTREKNASNNQDKIQMPQLRGYY